MPINESDIKQFFDWTSADKYRDLDNWLESVGPESKQILINSKCNGQTALDLACEASNETQVGWLLTNNADINLPSKGIFPINAAISADRFNWNIFDMLVKAVKKKNGEFVVQLDADNKGPLDHAVHIDDEGARAYCVTSLLTAGASTVSHYHSPLLEAIKMGEAGHKILFSFLYHYSSKCSIFDSLPGIGNALYVAAQYGNIYAADVIIAKAREMESGSLRSLINNEQGELHNLVEVAIRAGHLEFAKRINAKEDIPQADDRVLEGAKEKNAAMIADADADAEAAAALAAYEAYDPEYDSIRLNPLEDSEEHAGMQIGGAAGRADGVQEVINL